MLTVFRDWRKRQRIQGGGISVRTGSTLFVVSCIFNDNTIPSTRKGAGIYIAAGCSASLSNATFGSNPSQDIYVDSLGTLLLAEKDQSDSTNQFSEVAYAAGSDVFLGCRRGYFGKLITESGSSSSSLPAYNSEAFNNKFPGVTDCNRMLTVFSLAAVNVRRVRYPLLVPKRLVCCVLQERGQTKIIPSA